MPTLVYWPTVAVPFAVQVMTSPTANVSLGQPTATPWSSVTVTAVKGSFPVFVTTYVQATGSPTGICGPIGMSASSPLVYFLMAIAGDTPK